MTAKQVFARQVAVARPTDDLKVHKVSMPTTTIHVPSSYPDTKNGRWTVVRPRLTSHNRSINQSFSTMDTGPAPFSQET